MISKFVLIGICLFSVISARAQHSETSPESRFEDTFEPSSGVTFQPAVEDKYSCLLGNGIVSAAGVTKLNHEKIILLSNDGIAKITASIVGNLMTVSLTAVKDSKLEVLKQSVFETSGSSELAFVPVALKINNVEYNGYCVSRRQRK